MNLKIISVQITQNNNILPFNATGIVIRGTFTNDVTINLFQDMLNPSCETFFINSTAILCKNLINVSNGDLYAIASNPVSNSTKTQIAKITDGIFIFKTIYLIILFLIFNLQQYL